MTKNKKRIGFAVLAIVLVFVGKYVYDMNINHNFETITEGKVYKSGVIPPDELKDWQQKWDSLSLDEKNKQIADWDAIKAAMLPSSLILSVLNTNNV